jgi:hypothetical protein
MKGGKEEEEVVRKRKIDETEWSMNAVVDMEWNAPSVKNINLVGLLTRKYYQRNIIL